ncbi:sigma-70 family RNA polymerase sigma factor [Actinophytocola sp.]|uniref:RNA polymerase sigma factor n=1 Tax=Actinophytocola sp. TaxID=1872138 RepID=UPI002D7E6D01|nr:sigma-70 family RNA polymerase sigma factor [Actinophytocola sp.]HET9143514.1 sigma-70 family RNA polymerase sigma factor [Actinophytocola sp.]
MRYDSPVTTLLENAGRGKESAWQEIVDRYAPLVLSVCRWHGIRGADADDIAGSVWLRLVVNLTAIREPAALPGWLRTTTRRECLTLLGSRRREVPNDEDFADHDEPPADTSLLHAERRQAVRQAFGELPDRDRRLLALLFSDPPTPYAQISTRLGMPIGAIGPTRARCLARVRRTPAIAALLSPDPLHTFPERCGAAPDTPPTPCCSGPAGAR